MFEAILFDMDGLLFDTETLYLALGKPVLEEMGYAAPETVMLQTIGASSKKAAEVFRKAYGDSFDAPQFSRLFTERSDQYLTQNGVPLKPGAAQLLLHLRSRNYRMAVASSSRTETVRQLVGLAGFSDCFDALVGCDQVARAKPAPDLYLAAAEKVGASPERCLALEDSPMGIQSALAAGCITVIVPDHIAPPPELAAKAHAVLDSLFEVPAVLQQLDPP